MSVLTLWPSWKSEGRIHLNETQFNIHSKTDCLKQDSKLLVLQLHEVTEHSHPIHRDTD